MSQITVNVEADAKAVIGADKKYVWHHLLQHQALEDNDPPCYVKGQGIRVTDINGKTYVDATSGGLWTANLGYGQLELIEAIREQISKIHFFGGPVASEPAALFASAVSELAPGLDRVYLSSSGSEANEKAYKIVRQLAFADTGGKKHKIIYRNRDYHGTTIATLSSSGHNERKDQYGPFVEGFVEMPHCLCYRCPFGKSKDSCNIECARELENIILREGPDTVGSVVLEPITAGGGVITPVAEYWPIIQDICKKYNVLLHIDEVVCGMGRTGEWFGYQHYGVDPDLVTAAKGVASGYAAISILLAKESIFNRFKENAQDKMSFFRDISTFGGCTAGPAAALKVIEIIKRDKLIENAAQIGSFLKSRMEALQERLPSSIGEVRGRGLIIGLEMIEDARSKAPMPEEVVLKIVAKCMERGLLIGRTNRSISGYNNVVIVTPPLVCTMDDAEFIASTIESVLIEFFT